VALADVPALISSGKIWNSGTLVALPGLLALVPPSAGGRRCGGEACDPAAANVPPDPTSATAVPPAGR